MSCSICGREMADPVTKTELIGVQVRIKQGPEFQRVYPELENVQLVNVCYVCWLRSLGAVTA